MFPLSKGTVSWFFLFFCLLYSIESGQSSETRVVCYYTNWSVYRPGTAKFNPQNINPYLCTHLIYAFGGFTKDNTLKPFDKYQDIEQGGYAKFTGLKTYNKELKTLLAIGGWNEASSRFSPLVANAGRRQKFVKSIIKFLRQNHFDGLDLDWEYPNFRDGGKPRDKDNYAQFVQELREEFDRESSKTGRPRLLVTMAVPAGIEYIEKGYDIPKLNKYLDWFNILTYDYHSAFEPSVNHHAPLKSLEEDDEYNFDSELNIDHTVKFYLTAGADRDKLVLGIPTYGRSYTLFNADANEIGAPADGPGDQGDATREKGYLAYYEICQNIKEDEWSVVQPNPDVMGPYAFKDTQWVGYDDEAMARKKGIYVAENGLGGIMFWSIDNDDFRGICGGKPYPIIEAAKEALLDSLGVGGNDIIKSTHAQRKPNRSRGRPNSSDRNRISKNKEKSDIESKHRSTTIASRGNSRRRKTTTTSTTTTTFKPYESLIPVQRTTPEPPTTPDPGSDFKCEDEGFFPHPRDCKKYFWCLDSGPSNLGIVAHQFTCPSGLFFNKAADSCDYSRNVLCKIKDISTVKPITTTTAATPPPSKVTFATSRTTLFRTTTTSTTPAYEEDEYEDDDEEEEEETNLPHRDIEDPRVIKELIDLIKKAGGLEELEKQLQFQEDGSAMLSNSKSREISTTPATISKSLYQKVLSRTAAGTFPPKNRYSQFFNRKDDKNKVDRSSEIALEKEVQTEEVRKNSDSKYSSVVRNSRPSPQNAGLDQLPEFEGFLKEKPKYVTIQRTKSTSTISPDDEDDDDENENEDESEEEEDDEEEDDVQQHRQRVRYSTPTSNLQYVNIRRQRPTTEINEKLDAILDEDDSDTANLKSNIESTQGPQYLSISRRRPTTTTETITTESDLASSSTPSNRYKFIERSRPTTTTDHSVTAIVEGSDVEYSQTSSSSSTSLSLSTSSQSLDSTTLVPSTNIKSTITTINPDNTRVYANFARRTTQQSQEKSTELPTTTSILYTTQKQIFDIVEFPETNIITTTNEPIIETETLIYNNINNNSNNDNNDDKTEVTTILGLTSNLSLITDNIVSNRDTTSKPLSIFTQTTTTTTKTELNSISLNNNNHNNSSSSNINNNNNSSINISHKISNTNNTNYNNSYETSTFGSNIQNDFSSTLLVPRPFGFSRRTRPATSTSTISTTNGVPQENPVSPSKVSSSLSFVELNRRKNLGVNKTSSLSRTITEVGNISSSDGDDDFNADNYSKSFLSRPKPFSVPLPIETVENKFKSRDRKRPLGSRVSQSPQPSPSSILPSEVNKVLTTSTDSASDISSATQRPRANVIRSRGRGRYQVPQITQGYNQVASTSHRPPSAPRPFRPALHQIDDNDSKIEETSQKNIVRPLRPKGFENDLSSLTAGDFSRLVGVNRRKSVRITRPPTTRASTTEEPDYIEDLIETENPIIRPLRPTGFESDLSSLTAADFSRGVNPSRKPLKVTRRPGIRRTTIRTTTKNTRNYVIQEEQKENKFNSQSEVRRPFSSRITPSFNVSEKNKSDEPRNSLSDKSLSINRFSSQSFRKGRLNLSSTEDLKEIKETINVTLQKIDKPNFQRRPFRPAAINSLANDEVASSIDILNLEKNPDSQFIPRQLNVSSRVNTINITAGNFRVFENISNINSQLASTNENDDQSTINNSVKVSLGRKINSGLESETDSTKNDHLTVTEIINELINFGTNISDVSNNEELDSSTDSNKIISSNENSTNNVKILSLVNSANQINSEAHENSLNENIENITETQNITENSNEIESTTIIDTIIESQTKKIGIEEEKKIQTLETTSKKNIIEEIKPIFFSNRTRLLQGLTSNSSLSDFLEITDDKLTIDSKKLLNHSSALPETSLKNSTAEEKLIINRRRPVNSSFNSRITNSTETDSVVKITNGTDVRKRIRPTRPSRISLISSTEDSLIIDEQSTKNTEETSRNSVRKRPGFSSRTTTIERQRIQKPENNYRSSTTELSINEDDSVDANGEVITTERVLNSTIRSKITFGSGRQRIQRPGFNIQKTAGESDNVTDSAIERDVNTASQKNESSNGRRRITFVNGSQGIKRPGFNRAKPLKESSKNEEISIDINKESTITEQTEDTTTSKIVFGSGRQRVKRPVFTTENPISTLTDDKDSSVNENDESTTTEPNENLTTRDNISFGNGRLRIKRPGFSTYETITDSSDIEGDPVDVIDETTVTEETGTLTTHRRKVFGNEKQRNQTPLNLITESSTDEDSSVDEITATEQIESLTSRNIVSFDTARQRNQNSRLKITESTTESSDIEDDSTATEQIDSLTTRSRIKFGNGRQRTQTPRFNTQNSVTESSDNEDDVSTATEQTDNITIRNRVVFGIGRQRTQRPKYNTQSTITESSDIENDYSTVTEQTEGYTTRSRIAFGRQQPGLDRLKLTTESSDNNDDTGDENEDITLTEFAKDTTIRSRISFGNRRQRPQRPGLNRLKLTTNSSDNNEDTGDENDKNAVTEGSKSTTIRSRISFANGRQRTQKPGLKTLKLTKEFSDNDDNAVDEIDEITATEDSKNGGSRVRIAFGSGRKINQRPELIRIRVTTESSDNNDDFVEENDELTTTDKQTKKTTNRTRINFGTARQRIQRPGFNVRKSSNPSNNEDDSIDEHENDSVTESVDNTRHKIAFGTNRKRIQRPGYKSRGSTTELSRNSNESIDGNEEEPPADQILKPITSNKNKFGIEKPAIRRPEFSPRVSTTESSNNINDSDDVNDETTEVEQTESSTTRRKIAFGIGRERFGLNSRISLNKSSIDDTFDRNIETDIVKPTIQSKIEFGKQRIQNLGLKYRKTTTATDKPIDEILDGNEEINDAVNNKTIHDELITEKTDGVLSSLNEIGVVQITGTHLVSNSSQNSTDFISIELDANNEKSISETTLGPRRRKVIRKKIMPTIAPENNFNISSIDEELSKSVNNFNISSIDEELSKSISSITLSPNNATSDIPRRRKIIRKVRPSKNLTENIATVEIVTQYNLNLESESSDNKTESEKKFESENVPDQIGKFNILSDGNAFEITEKEKTEKSEYDGSVNETKKVSGKDRVSKSQILTGSNINLLEDEAEIYNNNENRTKVRLNRTHLNRTEFISSKLESKNTDRDNKKLLNIINKTRVDRVRPVGLKINRAIGNQSIPSLNTLEQDERKTTFGLEYEDETAVEDDGSKPKIQIKTSNFKLNHTKFNKTLINATNKNVTAKDTIGKVAIRLSEENKISLEVENETSKTNTSTAGGFELNHTNFNHTSFSGLNISTSKEENAVIENEGLLTSNESEETNISSIKPIGFSINQTHHNQTVILKETVIHDEESEYEESDEVKNTKINRIRPDGFKLHSIQFNSTTNITEQNTFNENDGPVKLTDEHSKSYRIGLGGHQFNQTQSNFTEISAKNITNHESISKSDKNMELEELVVDSEEQNIVTDIPSLTSSTIIPHRNRLIGINRPSFKPRRPSSSEVISSTESSSTTSKNYVRKFSNRFSLGRKPEEIVASEENVGLFDPNPIVIRPVRPEIRPLRPNFGISRYNVDEYEESEERFSDEEEEESIEEEVFKSVVRKPSFNHLNRNRFGTNQNSRVEDDESIEERPNGRPNYQGYNNRYNPNRFQTEEKEESDNSSYESEEEYNNNYKEKSETARPIFRYTAPPRLPQPRPSFRTIGSATTTIHPASLKFKLTPVDSTTQSIRELELIKSRNYERKYFPSTTDINNVQPNLLEELDVNAINARNKKIFNEHKKFTTTTTQRINNITEDSNVQQTLDSLTIIPDTPPTTTTDEQYDVTTTDSNTIITTTIIQDSDDSYTSTQKMELTDIIDEKEVFNTNIILQETGTTELSSTKRTKLTTTTTQKPTTLHHIFAIDEDSSIDNIRDRLQSSGESSEQISKKLEKLVEINRIVEVYSKQEKIRNINDTDNTESFNWVLEKVPTLDKLGEISRIILIRLQNHNKTESEQFTGYEKIDQFLDTINKINKTSRSNTTTVTNVSSKNPENNLIIDSKSSFADYSPTEYPSTSPLTPVRNIIPVETTIDGEDNLIETIYSTVERPDNMIVNSNLESTIKLNNNDNVKRHEVLPLEGKKSRNIYFADMVESVETSTIPLEGLFHREREAKETSFSEDKEIPLINSILTTTPVYYNRDESSSVSGLLDIIKPPSKSNDQEISAKQLTSPVFISDPHYVRPLAPFLRPESNESSPLVISIANLDQVILSKVEKTNKTKFFNHPERAQIKSNVGIATHELNIDHTANIKPAIITDADINSEELRTLKKRAKDDKQIDFNDNPPLSIIQEQTNSENKSSKIQNFKPAKVRPHYRPNFRRPAINNVTQRVRSTTTSPSNKVTEPTESLNSISTFVRRTRPTKSTTITTPQSSTLMSTYETGSPRPTSKLVVRRKFTPKPSNNGERRKNNILTTTTTKSPDVGIPETRTVNPLFRRKFTFTTRRPIQTTAQTTVQTAFDEFLATTIPTIGLDEGDQEAGSSILQDSKFLKSRFNQIGESIDDDIVEALQAISKAPLPVHVTSTTLQPHQHTIRRKIPSVQIITTTTFQPKTVNIRRKKPQAFDKIKKPKTEFPGRTYRPVIDYDYYDDGDIRIIPKSSAQVKVVLHGQGIIECLDQGNFAHPLSCRKFISCAKMETGGVVGWEYTCPKGLSYDPVGGLCNWEAGLGCKE